MLSYYEFFFLILRRPPGSTRFPSRTLFRPADALRRAGEATGGDPPAPEAVAGLAADGVVALEDGRLYRAATARLEADRKSTRLNSSHANISYAVFCLKKKINTHCWKKSSCK